MPRNRSSQTDRDENSSNANPTRRDFLKGTTTAAAGLLVPTALSAQSPNLLPTTTLGSHTVTRLIIGSNPIYGYSHFNKLYNQDMLEWFTDEHIMQLLTNCEKNGINTWQFSFNWEEKRQIPMLRALGSKLQLICLVASWHFDPKMGHSLDEVMDGALKCAEAGAQYKPIALVLHSQATDIVYRAGKLDFCKTFINKCHDLGCAAAISVDDPVKLKALHEMNLNNEFWQTGLHYLKRHREDWIRDIGAQPLDEGWIDTDPPKMAAMIRQVDKPCITYKVLGGGRKCNSEEQKRQAIEWYYKNVKPTDCAIIGMYPRWSDQPTETCKMVRDVLA